MLRKSKPGFVQEFGYGLFHARIGTVDANEISEVDIVPKQDESRFIVGIKQGTVIVFFSCVLKICV
jgi:predicted RecB family endonuclease